MQETYGCTVHPQVRRHACAKVVQRERRADGVLHSRCPSTFHEADALATCVEFYTHRVDLRPLLPARHAHPAFPASPIERVP
jgi:hypothetical protein